jgi:hypothetical protein
LIAATAEPLEDGPTRGIGERLEKDIVGLLHLDQ